jgi:hypothetical protein
MKANIMRRPRRKATCQTDLFGLAHDTDHLAFPGVRVVLSKVNVSPAVAFVIAMAAGLVREAAHG